MTDYATATEEELRDSKTPPIESMEALVEFVRTLADREHDYGTAVYAMSLAADAAFNYVAHSLGVTGFQASVAQLDWFARQRDMEFGFRVIDYGDLRWPQSARRLPIKEIDESLANKLSDWALKRMRQDRDAHPEVLRWWDALCSKCLPGIRVTKETA